MEHQHEPGSIGDLMLKAAENCAQRQREKAIQLKKDAATDKARGDSFYKAGEWNRAAGEHGRALKREAIAKACEDAAADIEKEFGLYPPQDDEKRHNGVGEGDAGLTVTPPHPEHAENLTSIFEIDELPLEQLSRKQWEHLAIGIERATDWMLLAPVGGGWQWGLQDKSGAVVWLSGLMTAREVFDRAMRWKSADDAEFSKLETTDLNSQ